MTPMSATASRPTLELALAALCKRIDTRLDQLLPEPDGPRDPVAAAMRSGVLAPGKRLRPLLLLLTTEAFARADDAALDLACAVEMVHAASLFLDDMPCMDNAQLRRGRPTIHVQYGEDIAVLASVALLSHAFAVTASLETVDPLMRSQLVRLLSQAIGAQGLVRGQYYDLHGGRQARALDAIARANQYKTGSLFVASLEMGGLLAALDEARRQQLRAFAHEFGLAFQLLDDLNDGQGSDQTGKDAHQDQAKSTVVALLGPDAARRELASHVERARAHLEGLGQDEGPLGQLLTRVFGAAR